MSVSKNELIASRERKWAHLLGFLLVLSAITGMLTWPVEEAHVWVQWTWLFHTFISFLLSIIWLPYIYVHVQRILGYRRWGVFLMGLAGTLISFLMIGSGLYLIFYGQTEQTRWVLDWHIWSALGFLGLLVIHLLLHVATLPQRRRDAGEKAFTNIDSKLARYTLLGSLGLGLALALFSFLHGFIGEPYTNKPIVDNYEYSYGEHPFRPSQTETWHGQFVDHRQIGISDDCRACHQDIAEEWASSVHKQAASDRTYVSNISLLAENAGMAATRYCEGCHAPVALLSGQLSPGGNHGGIADTLAFDEGVGCMGCHGIHKVVHLKGVASYEFQAKEDYLFAKTDNRVLTELRHLLIRLQPEQHRQSVNHDVTDSPNLCATCHVQFMDKDMNDWGWVKMQDEYSAWLNSPYSRQHDQVFAEQEVVRCQDCHMPLVAGNDPSANTDAKHRQHRFLGANTVLPLLANDEQQLQLTKSFLQQNKMRLAIDEPRRLDATQTLMPMDEKARPQDETPFFAYLGEELKYTLIVSNIGVGHNFPGGTLDINEAWLATTVMDGTGKVIFESGQLNQDGSVDEDAVFYRSLPTDRKGQIVWKHDLFNRVGQAYKRVVPAGKSDLVEYSVDIPYWVKGPLTITATLKYRKLNIRYAKWALQEDYQEIPIIDMARATLAVPLFEKPPVFDGDE